MPDVTFKEGDIVELKSGGPRMVVSSIDTDFDSVTINCEWFAATKREFGTFNPATLKLVE